MAWQVSKNSTVRKNDYNIVTNPKDSDAVEFDQNNRHERAVSGMELGIQLGCTSKTLHKTFSFRTKNKS